MPNISTSHSPRRHNLLSQKHIRTISIFPHSSKKFHPTKQLAGEAEPGGKGMASTSAVSMAVPLTYTTSQKRAVPSSEAFFKAPLPLRSSKAVSASKSNGRFQVRASMKEKVVTGLTAAALTASMMVPDAAEAAVSPSLKNFLLSIVAGGVVAAAIVGAVIGVANFDPVKRS
ncbi:uncharacterized protein LOC133305381 [Gastrolobium bilobum]|uniref:uncharacterized protein LOC133305381 n=1 Tax=Gastrolobium bilobum TaxID=150636 RepID=UPI002AB32455|nr:uncharacterized protein LOC133305381 [Gastrolobium bilobum]